MTGNDIVDLQAAATESNWRRKGFVQKIFTAQEHLYIDDAASQDEMVWRLWTMKESAYKLYTRQEGGYFFGPQQFGCTILSATDGQVDFQDHCYTTLTTTNNQYIYTIAKPIEKRNLPYFNDCFLLQQTDDPSAFINNRITGLYATVTGNSPQNLIVIKKNRIPFLYCGVNLQVPLSITHHGRFAAFTIY